MSEPIKSTVVKTVSMPMEMYQGADQIVQADPELDWSKYIRRLIREDLARAKASQQQPVAQEAVAA